MDTPPLILFKAVSISTSKWKKLMEKGGRTLQSWNAISPPLQESLISSKTIKSLRDSILSVLKGIAFSGNSTSPDPPLPMPELIRDEYNAYKKTLLQEHLYELIFKESKSSSTASTSASLMELPSLSPCPFSCSEFESSPILNLQEIETSIIEFIAEVALCF